MTDFVWVGGSGAYSDPNQWRNADAGTGPPAGPPGLADTGTIDNGVAIIAGVLAGLGSGEVGAESRGGLLVENSGAILIANGSLGLELGVAPGATGTLAVTTGGLATIDGPLVVGANGTGALVVQSGATVDVGNAGGNARVTVAGMEDSGGSIAVEGAGSHLDLNDGLVMGTGANGVDVGNNNTSIVGFGVAGLSVAHGGSAFVGNSVLFDGTIAVDPASTLEIGPAASGSAAAGASTVDHGATLSGAGTITGNVVNDGLMQAIVVTATFPVAGSSPPLTRTIIQANSTAITGNIAGTGTTTIAGSSELSVSGAVGAGQTMAFTHDASNFGTLACQLDLAAPGEFAGTIADMQPGDFVLLQGATITGGSLTGTIGASGTLALDGFSASVLGVSALPFDPSGPASFEPTSPMALTAAGAVDVAATAAPLAQLTPPDGALNEVFVAPGAALPTPVAGALNEAVVIDSGAAPPDTTLALPAGYQAAFGGASLSDANGDALLVGADTITATGGNDTLLGGPAEFLGVPFLGNSTEFFAGGSGGDSIVATGGGTVVCGIGNDTIQTSSISFQANANLGGVSHFAPTAIAPGAGDDLINALGPDTIYPGAGSDTVFAYGVTGQIGTASSFAIGALAAVGSGTLFFINGIAPSTIIGGNSGTDIVNAGAGGGIYGAGGGGSLLFAGSGAATLFGVAGGDVLFAGGSATDLLIAGAGNETLSGLGSSGNNTFYGGSGNDLMGGGAGSETFFAGTGSDTMIAGSGADLFAFVNGLAGGTDLIEGFNTAAGDRVTLQNYGADAVQSALASATVAGGSTAITLPDHTTILFQGVTNLTSAAFV